MRELADAIAARAFSPELTALQMCRVGRASAELVRTAAGVERLLDRRQQKPAAFFGTVLADEVDVAAVDAAWGRQGAGAGVVPQRGTSGTFDDVELMPPDGGKVHPEMWPEMRMVLGRHRRT